MVSQRQKITQEKLKNAGNNNIYYVRKNISMKSSNRRRYNMDKLYNSTFYVYYGKLNTKQKNIYSELYTAINNGKKKYKLKTTAVSQDVFDAIHAIYYDHPELFWLGKGCKVQTINNLADTVEPEYNSLFENCKQKQSELKRAVQSYLSGLNGKTIPEKERIIHDRMIKSITYQSNTLDQTAYASLVMGKAVCAGYSRGFQLLMNILGIPCYYVAGLAYSKEKKGWGNHAWNIVKIDNDYYNIDITWNDCYDSSANKIGYKYYNCTDSYISGTHRRKEESKLLPKCNGKKYSFERVNGACAELESIYQDKVTSKDVVSDQKDFIAAISPILKGSAQKRFLISFPVNKKKVINNSSRWFKEAMTQYDKDRYGWHSESRVTDYKNGWYKFEINVSIC